MYCFKFSFFILRPEKYLVLVNGPGKALKMTRCHVLSGLFVARMIVQVTWRLHKIYFTRMIVFHVGSLSQSVFLPKFPVVYGVGVDVHQIHETQSGL